MGLASALSTALTGMTGSETTIDVVGNNLANSSTVGFKASDATFATQFLQTYSLGSGPTANYGGTNPTQIGLGSMVSSIQANFTEGTISNTSLVSDMAVQGNGFFIIQANDGSYAYTRDGEFNLNSQNQLVTASGNLVLGYTVDNNFNIQTGSLAPLTIPFGTKMVAQATQNVVLNGTLPPTGGIADTAQVIDTETLGDDTKTLPDASTAAATNAADVGTVSTTDGGANTGHIQAGDYSYKLVYSMVNGSDPYSESVPSSDTVAGSVAADDSSLVINHLYTVKASATTAGYQYINIYRAPVAAGGAVGAYGYIKSVKTSDITDATYTYTDTAATGGSNLDDDMLAGTYGYYVSFYNSTNHTASNPVAITNSSWSKSISAANQRIEIALQPAETASGD
ncbi:MAG: flagellar hook-basal body complex protein, partial [Thermoguttaceae bacterium]